MRVSHSSVVHAFGNLKFACEILGQVLDLAVLISAAARLKVYRPRGVNHDFCVSSADFFGHIFKVCLHGRVCTDGIGFAEHMIVTAENHIDPVGSKNSV